MARLIKAQPNEIIEVEPKNGTHFELKEVYDLIGCKMVQMSQTRSGKILLSDEDGKMFQKPFNQAATEEYKYGEYDLMVGDVLICEPNEFR